MMMMTYKTPCYADYIIVDNFSITHLRLWSMSVRVLHNRGAVFRLNSVGGGIFLALQVVLVSNSTNRNINKSINKGEMI